MDRKRGSADQTTQARRDLAMAIHDLLNKGQRPVSDRQRPVPQPPWKNSEFAEKVGKSESLVRAWRDLDDPTVPGVGVIIHVLNAFYGDISAWRAEKAELHEKWLMATGRTQLATIDDEGGNTSADWTIFRAKKTAGLALLELYAPRPGNIPDTFYLHATLRIGIAKHERSQDGEVREVLIGIKEAALSLKSKTYRTQPGTMIGERDPRDNFQPETDVVKIVGPAGTSGCLEGDALGEEHIAIIEPVAADDMGEGDRSVTVLLSARRRSFKIFEVDETRQSGMGLSVNKEVILNELIYHSAAEKDELGNVILARSKVQRKPNQ